MDLHEEDILRKEHLKGDNIGISLKEENFLASEI